MGLSFLSVTVPVSILEVGLVFLVFGSPGGALPVKGIFSCARAQPTKMVATTSVNSNFFITTLRESLLLGQLRQMQPNILAFIIVDPHSNFGLGLAFWGFDVRLNHIILGARRNALGKFAASVGHELPLGLLVSAASNLDGNTCHRPIVRAPDGADDQRVILAFSLLRRRRIRSG